jgi:hypothetical protein
MVPGLVVLALLISTGAAPAAATAPACTAPTSSTTHPGYLVADPDCDRDGTPFTALPGATAHTGILAGAAYRIEVPRRWTGGLVIFAHGYRGTGTTVWVDDPDLRAHYVARGFAWAASSYATNGYDVGQGVLDSYALIAQFRQVTGRAARTVVMSGASMGGHVTAVAIERYPRAFAAAMPYCGVLGDTELFDYYLDANVVAAALAGVRIDFPLRPDAGYPDRWRAQAARIGAALGVTTGGPPSLTPAGHLWSDVVERRSGGPRPGFPSAFSYWNSIRAPSPLDDLPFYFGLYPGLTGGSAGIAGGNVTGNIGTLYRGTDGPFPTVTEWRLNALVTRVRPTAAASPGLSGIPRIDGTPAVPVLTLHDIGDLFVPFSMLRTYVAEASLRGRGANVVARAIRSVGHCDFTQTELREGFDDLITWTRTGRRPGGDDVLSRRTVADPLFGCRYTRATPRGLVAPPCP